MCRQSVLQFEILVSICLVENIVPLFSSPVGARPAAPAATSAPAAAAAPVASDGEKDLRDLSLYSKFDADGFPTHDKDGVELTKSQYKKVRKLIEGDRKKAEKAAKKKDK